MTRTRTAMTGRARRGVVTIAAIALLAAGVAAPPGTAGAQVVEPTVTVVPDADHAGGRQVTLQVDGFPPYAFVGYCQLLDTAPVGLDHCGEGVTPVGLDASGSGTVTVRVQRHLYVRAVGRSVDCAVEACALGIWEILAPTPTATAPLVFAPVPEPPSTPATVELSGPVSGSGQVVTVDVAGFRPGAVVELRQCAAAPDGPEACDSVVVDAVTDAGGAATLAWQVLPAVTTSGPAFDVEVPCFPTPGSCTITAFDAADPWRTDVSVPVPSQVPSIVPGAAAVAEGDAGTTVVEVPVSLTAPVPYEVTAQWTTLEVPGAPAGQATAGIDYQPASGTVAFPPGTTTATVPVTINGDVVPDPDAYIVVQFGNATNARMGGFWGLGFGGILDDD